MQTSSAFFRPEGETYANGNVYPTDQSFYTNFSSFPTFINRSLDNVTVFKKVADAAASNLDYYIQKYSDAMLRGDVRLTLQHESMTKNPEFAIPSQFFDYMDAVSFDTQPPPSMVQKLRNINQEYYRAPIEQAIEPGAVNVNPIQNDAVVRTGIRSSRESVLNINMNK